VLFYSEADYGLVVFVTFLVI